MKRKAALMVTIISLVLLTVAMPLVSACTQPEAPAPAPTPAPAPAEPAWEWPSTITIVSDVPGSNPHVMVSAWGPVMEQDTGMKVRITTISTAAALARMVCTGMVDFGYFIAMDSGGNLIPAKAGYATEDGGPFPLRISFPFASGSVGFFVRADSDIMTMDDLKTVGKGLRVGVSVARPDQAAFMDALLAWLDLDWEDVTRVEFGSYQANVLAVTQGKADVVVTSCASPHTIEAAASPHGIRFLEMDPKKDSAAAERWAKLLPTIAFSPCSLGVEEAQDLVLPAIAGYFGATEDQDPELVYHIIKWLDENFDAYKDKHPICVATSFEHFVAIVDGTWIPVHEGAIRYIKEKGLWTAAHDARQEYNIKVLDMYIEAYQAAIQMALEKQIPVKPDNDEWIELWENYKKELGLPALGLKSDAEISAALKNM